MAFFVLLLTMFNGIAQAQVEPFTFKVESEKYSEIDTKSYICEQNNEKEGLKIIFLESVGDLNGLSNGQMDECHMVFYRIELNLNFANHACIVERHENVGFPTKNGTNALLSWTLDNGTTIRKHVTVERSGQYVTIESNPHNYYEVKKGDIKADDFLLKISQFNITEIKLGCYIEDEELALQGFANVPNNYWKWELNNFKTAATITAMFQRINQEQEKQDGKEASPSAAGNSLSQGIWRTQMRKVFDNTTDNYSNSAYKGQKSNGYRHGLGACWWNESNGSYWGNHSNGLRHDYGIYISGMKRFINNCSGCVYYVGNWSNDVKHGKGNCYDKEGNLIYSGDFSNDCPTGTYPSSEKNSRYKFECIEYNSGDKYVGETYNGQRHGYGICLWKNGIAWYGPWKDGERDGYGILLYYKGDVKYGRWVKDTYYTN